MIRSNQKGTIETAEPAANPVACEIEALTEMSRIPGVIEGRAERLDEAGIA